MKKMLLCLIAAFLFVCPPLSALCERSYLIPDSNTRALSEDELWAWDYESLGYVLNEIFARHGYNFIAGEKYDRYFRCMPWYTPNADPDNQAACYPKLTRVEWNNEHLVKQVRADMRAMGTQNPSGKSVWDQFSTGFDTLQGFVYEPLKGGQKLGVYSAPSTKAWRGAGGKAKVSTNGNVFAAGWEDGWLLVMYETNSGSVRVGYVQGSKIKGNVACNTLLDFANRPATVVRDCDLTDDPARTASSIMTLPQGAQVTYLGSYFNRYGWDYVETIHQKKPVRGFVRSGSLSLPAAQEEEPRISDAAELFAAAPEQASATAEPMVVPTAAPVGGQVLDLSADVLPFGLDVEAAVEQLRSQGLAIHRVSMERGVGNDGVVRYIYQYRTAGGIKMTFTTEDGYTVSDILFVYESMTPTDEWRQLCRSVAHCENLHLPAGIISVADTIPLDRIPAATYEEADGYSVHVLAVMDTRIAWQLRKE